MNNKIRYSTIAFGLLLIAMSLFFLISNLLEFFQILNQSSLVANNDFSTILKSLSFSWSLIIILFILGFLIYYPLLHRKEIYLKASLAFLSLSIIFLTFSIFFFSINTKTENFASQIQYNIDYLVAYSLEELLYSNEEIQENKQLNLQINTKSKKLYLYNNNLTQQQTNELLEILQLNMNTQNGELFLKYLITQLHFSLKQENQEKQILPLETLNTSLYGEGITKTELENIDYIELNANNQISINQSAYLFLNIPIESQNIIVTIGNLNNEKIDLLWKHLELENTSKQTKEKFLDIILSQYYLESLNNNEISLSENQSSPFLISLPEEVKFFLTYDLFNPNISIRIENINLLRNLCNTSNNLSNELCDGLNNTIYENIILQNSNSENLTNGQIQIPKFVAENFKTTTDIENYIQERTNNYKFYFFLSILSILISAGIYYLQFYLKKEELPKTHIPYFLSKNLLLKIIFSVPVILILYLFLASNNLFSYIPQSGSSIIDIEIFGELPIIQTLLEIIKFSLFLHIFATLFFLICFLSFYYLQKKEINSNLY